MKPSTLNIAEIRLRVYAQVNKSSSLGRILDIDSVKSEEEKTPLPL